jgi:chitodextrinase
MFRSRRHLAAAAGFWCVLLAAAAGISLIPGATAAADQAVFSDTFESGNLSQWTFASGMTDQQQVVYAGRWSARATSSGSPSYAYKNLSTPLSELYYDGRFNAISQGNMNVSIARFRTAANVPIFSIFRNGNGKLSYYNGTTGRSTTGPRVSTGGWHELEVHARIDGSSSLVEVWLDGTKAITQPESFGTSPISRIYIGDNTTGHTFDYAFDNDVVESADSEPPPTPTGLNVTASTGTSISLGWTASTDNVAVVGYDEFVNGTEVGSTAGTGYTFANLACGRSYTLSVDAYDAAGNTSGRASVTASTASCSGVPPPDVTPPSTPTGLTVTAASLSSISFSWSASTDSVGVAGYDVFKNNSALGTTTQTSYSVGSLVCGTTYTLGVDAFDAAGNVSGRTSITAATSSCGGGGGGGGYLKVLDSTDSLPKGLSDDSNNCTLARSELGDTFSMLAASDRCTWTNSDFSHMHRHEVFQVSERFDLYTHVSDWTNNILIRPSGSFGNANCSSGGNSQVMLVTVRIKDDDHYWLELRGGPSLQPADQSPYYSAVDMGPVVPGRTDTFKFDIVSDYQHGAATVWHNGAVVYNNRDRPLGFHYDCNGTTDISNLSLRMQHGVYRGWLGLMVLTSSGFGFTTSEPE